VAVLLALNHHVTFYSQIVNKGIEVDRGTLIWGLRH